MGASEAFPVQTMAVLHPLAGIVVRFVSNVLGEIGSLIDCLLELATREEAGLVELVEVAATHLVEL
ncbi:hypothetical protein DY245_12825 [Streptomyces inhibens]|uniref:Uncharacterized protein n=1 Tax=Streptomyces inhibens TaxID=2293571 RepID=A0A371Q5H0_STRIH|nr:hypothetical protein DY245_12825 [Streptomyces inhibens]